MKCKTSIKEKQKEIDELKQAQVNEKINMKMIYKKKKKQKK